MIEERLAELGIELPPAPRPVASYVPVKVVGGLAFVAGQIPMAEGAVRPTGSVGGDVSVEEANAATRRCAIQALAALKDALGSLDRVRGIAKVDVFVASAPGFTDQPTYDVARDIGDTLISAFLNSEEEPIENAPPAVDEVHVVYTRFRSMLTQEPTAVRLLPLEVVEGEERPEEADLLPLYEFEPSPADVLDSLLPRYVQSRIFFALLQASASELAARQKAMKSATDNADELIKTLSRIMNRARQDAITTEIMEIVGGAEALRQTQSSETDTLVDQTWPDDLFPPISTDN